jgi:hypothetical protein
MKTYFQLLRHAFVDTIWCFTAGFLIHWICGCNNLDAKPFELSKLPLQWANRKFGQKSPILLGATLPCIVATGILNL